MKFTLFFNVTLDWVFITLIFDGGGGGVDYLKPIFICENNRKSNFLGFFLHGKYSQISKFTGVSKGLVFK